MLLVAFITLIVLAVSSPKLLASLGNYLVLEQFDGRAAWAVVLAGEFPNRTMEAAQLYREGRIDNILLTRQLESAGLKKLKESGIKAATQQQRSHELLLQLGIPNQQIYRLHDPANSTKAEAILIKQWLQTLQPSTKRPKTLLLVTSKTHTKRANKIFAHILGRQINLAVKPSRYDDFLPSSWWKQRHTITEVILEYEKLLAWLLWH